MSSRARRLHRSMSAARAALNRPRLSCDENPPPEPAGPSQFKTATNLVIVDTKVVDGPPGTGISHYQIVLTTDPADPRQLTVLTRDEALYHAALQFEGSDQRVTVTYHPSQRPSGAWCFRLDAMAVVP